MGPKQRRGQQSGDKNGRRTVRAADDADGAGFLTGEAHKAAADKRDKNTELRRRAQQQALGIGDEGAEVRHGANAHENKAGINTQLHTEVEDVHQSRADRYVREGHAVVGRSLLRLHQRLQLCAKGGNTVCGRRGDLRYGAADRLRGEHGLRGGHELLQIWREHIFRHALIVKLR